jgi:hypothetical protein
MTFFLCAKFQVVHYVDIGGIVDHHCLNFLFISSPPPLLKDHPFCNEKDAL